MCGMIRLGETETALGLLKDVLESAAHSTLHWIERDSDLDPIRDTPEFTAWWAEVFGRGDAAMG